MAEDFLFISLSAFCSSVFILLKSIKEYKGVFGDDGFLHRVTKYFDTENHLVMTIVRKRRNKVKVCQVFYNDNHIDEDKWKG